MTARLWENRKERTLLYYLLWVYLCFNIRCWGCLGKMSQTGYLNRYALSLSSGMVLNQGPVPPMYPRLALNPPSSCPGLPGAGVIKLHPDPCLVTSEGWEGEPEPQSSAVHLAFPDLGEFTKSLPSSPRCVFLDVVWLLPLAEVVPLKEGGMLMRLHRNETQRLRGLTQVYKNSRQLLGERMSYHGVAACELCRGLQWQGFPELSPKVEFSFSLTKLLGLLCSAGYPSKLIGPPLWI